MAALHSPEAPPRPAPQLRDSCHACAASKVKCNKVKPVCGRCAKRGTLCEYVASKRAGRKSDRTSDAAKVTKALPRPRSSMSSEPSHSMSPGLTQPSPKQQTPAYPDILPNLFSPADTSSSSLITSSTSFDDFFTSLMPLPALETSDCEILPQPYSYSTSVDNGLLDSNDVAALHIPDDAFSVVDEAVSELPTLSKPRSPPESRAPTTSDAQSFQSFQALRSESPCCCLLRALALLKQLFVNASTACTCSRRQNYDNSVYQLPTIQSIIVENKRAIEAVDNILKCPCSQDGYLLSIISLIVFKVLGWYTAAARETPATDGSQSPSKSRSDSERHSSCYSEQVVHPPTVVGSYSIDGEDQGRMAAQLVLGELHRVQQLINLLSQRLKGHGVRNVGVDTPNSAADGQDPLPEGENTSPFSATMLGQLEADLRKRLRALSLEIINMLRRG